MLANNRQDLLRAVADGPILLDAAMGTRLIAAGLDLESDDPALWVLDRPGVVARIHRQDLTAGADALLTNTFGANRVWLARFGREDDCGPINAKAVKLARIQSSLEPTPSRQPRFVIGSIGPIATQDLSALLEQAEALVGDEDGVDAFLLETCLLDQAEFALAHLRRYGVPIIPSLFAWPELISDAARRLVDLGAPVLGANCLAGMQSGLATARKLRDACDLPLLIKPATAAPGVAVEALELFEAAVPELIGLGVRLLGGCCGSTEAHVAAFRRGLDRLAGP